MFDDESLDGVVSALVYHYIHDRMGVLREIRRALRPEGWLVLSTSHPVRGLARRRRELLRGGVDRGRVRPP